MRMNTTQGQSGGESSTGALQNYEFDSEYVKVADDGSVSYVPLWRSPRDIARDLYERTGGWPKTVGRSLFYAKKKRVGLGQDPDAVTALDSLDAFETWVMENGGLWFKTGRLESRDGVSRKAASLANVYEALRLDPFERFDEVASVPHVPERKRVYYLETKYPRGDGEALREFMDHLNPNSEQDRDLLLAALMTPFAGLSPGQRPAFVFTSPHGRGAGKTATAEAIANVAGGNIRLNAAESEKRWVERLLSSVNMTKRVVLLDNVKRVVDMEAMEDLITSEAIQGHALYKGDTTRTNYLTFFLTLNSPEMSRDLAQRSVIIELGEPRMGVDFMGWLSRFMEGKRWELVQDILSYLEEDVLHGTIHESNRGRFGQWENFVLKRFRNSDQLAILLNRRRGSVDHDLAFAEEVFDALWEMLQRSGHDPEESRLVIPWNDVRMALLEKGLMEPFETSRTASALVRKAVGLGPMSWVTVNKNRRLGRGALWVGDKWTSEMGGAQVFDGGGEVA